MRLLHGITRLTSHELSNLEKTGMRICNGQWLGCYNPANFRPPHLKTIYIHQQQSGATIVTSGKCLLSIEPSRLDRRSGLLRLYSTDITKSTSEQKNTEISTSVVENIKETTKTVSYTAVVLLGFSVIIAIVYAVFSELFSSKSAHSVYSQTFAYVINDERVRKVFGNSIKAFGEETRRGRRQHVNHVRYTKDGKDFLRMKFYIKGDNGESGSVHVEMVENDKGKYEYRYLFINVDGIRSTPKFIILEDNRGKFENLPAASDEAALSEVDFSFK